MRVAVTGASGFIGTGLIPALTAHGHEPLRLPRTGFADLLEGADAVIHLAGLAHRTGRDAPSAEAFRAANADLPVAVQAAARSAGVPRMIHISTIAVLSGHPGTLREDMPAAPTTDYDRAKADGEAALLSAAGGPVLSIVRPPLVYGPRAKANLRSLARLCSSPAPLPFGSVHNHRSMVARGNLIDALLFLLDHPVEGILHVTDNRDLSLRDLVAGIRAGFGRDPGLLPFPVSAMRAALSAIGRGRTAEQLFGDQQVEMTALPRLGWRPPVAPAAELAAMGRAYAAKVS